MKKLVYKKEGGNKNQLMMKSNFLMLLCLSFLVLQSCSSYGDWELTAYDGELNWEQITKKAEWDKRLDHEVAVLNDELYLVGGYNPGKVIGDPYFEDVWKSSNGTDWTSLTEDAPWLGRRGHSLVTFNDGTGDALYLIGGFSVNEETGERAYNNDVWKSIDGANWVEIKTNTDVEVNSSLDWVARMHHKCIVANHGGQDYIYLVGGYTMRDTMEARYAIQYCKDVWRSTNGINWVSVGVTDYGIRAEHAMTVAANGTIYLQGGQHGVIFDATDSTGLKPVESYQDVWKSTNGETWTPLSDAAIVETGFLHRTGHEMVFYKDKIWTLPGKTNSLNHYSFSDPNHYGTWTLDMNDTWAIDSHGVGIDARHSYATVVWRDKIWVFGGNTNRNGQDNDIWAGSL
ncbi:MAG: hypothetical protein HC803_04485 [Saprospiraceae bacterium]|nr:hypothetical protein [Saprospiraceae bacterium]